MNSLYVNGRVTTMNPDLPECNAFSVENGRITYVGSEHGARAALAGLKFRTVDLKGRRVLPGLIDAHAHLSLFSMEWANLRLKGLGSIDAILDAVRAKANATPPGEWIRGFGYNHLALEERRHPTRADLDRAAPHHPVLLMRTCGHIAAVNTEALRRSGVSLHAPDPEGGRFDRNPDGSLNGVLYDQAMAGVQAASVPDKAELTQWMTAAARVWAQAGITAVHDAGGFPGYFQVLSDAFREERIPQRIDAMVWTGLGIDQLSEFLPSHVSTGFHRGDLYVGAAKIVMDGSSSGPTAATRLPYTSDPGFAGILYRSQETLERMVKVAVDEGFQVTAHAVGDRAVAIVAEVIGRCGDPNRRNRIEHCAMCPPDVREVMVKHHITPVAQPTFLYEFGDGYVDSYGWERGAHMFPLRSWFDAGLRVAGSSDSPVADYRPLAGVATAISRITRSGQVLAEDERISLQQALSLYTVNPAWLVFAESEMGRLAPGYRASFVVLAEDIFAMTDPRDVRDCPVRMTVIDDRAIWNDDVADSV
jgi:predicted amidohydrolase YtcJ